jgi:hypothetical protein
MYKGILFAVATMVASAAAAQSLPKSDPADATARTPSMEYRSAFGEYRPYSEPELAAWRAANEEVAGAHGAHGQDKIEKPAKTEKPAPQPPAHGGHK